MSASGADIWDTLDEFRYAYRELQGDRTIMATCSSGWQTSHDAGAIPRATFDIVTVSALALPAGWHQRYRIRRHGGAGSSCPPRDRNHRVHLIRRADLDQSGSDTFSIGDSLLVGLAVSSHDPDTLATGTFDNVAIASGP